jgi:DNA-binding PadR family transcriptional regulator
MPDSQINPTAAALLGLLHEGPMTGGQLMAAAERRLGPYWSMTRSQVYRELPVLAEMGYVRLGKCVQPLARRGSRPRRAA